MIRSSHTLHLSASLALLVALALLCLRDYYPPLPNPLAIDLILDQVPAGESDPLLVSGRTDYGDFLWVRRVDDGHVVFGYDCWSIPGITSPTRVTFQPGVPLHLLLDLPALDELHGSLSGPVGRVRVRADGAVVFDTPVIYHLRDPDQLWFGQNPLGGTACGPSLRGKLVLPGGREWRGNVKELFNSKARVIGWLRHSRQVWALLLICSAVAAGWSRLGSVRFPAVRAGLAALAPHHWFIGTATVCTLLFGWMITQGTFAFFCAEELGAFYDFQMAALLHGRLDVPEEAIGGEAFVIAGRLYGYFGPTPALLRLPFVAFGFAFGLLSRLYMLAYFVGGLVAGYLLLRQSYRLVGRSSSPSAVAVILFTAQLGLGSTLFFLGSRAYVYHEAILCGVVFALFSAHFALRHLVQPERRWWLWSLLCGLLSLHARPPTGLYALTLLGCVGLVLLGRDLRTRSFGEISRHVRLGVLCAIGVLTFNGLSYLKFKTFDGAPLRFSRPYTAERLARIEGKSFHLENIPYGFYTYMVHANFHVEARFPYLYLRSDEPGRAFPRAKMDLPDHTLALPWCMPGIVVLATLGGLVAWVTSSGSRVALFAIWAAAVPMSLALFAAIATAQRYTGDFVPMLGCGAAFGLAAVEGATGLWRASLQALFGTLVLWSIFLTFAITLHYQREIVWGVPEDRKQDYQHLRQKFDAWFKSHPTP